MREEMYLNWIKCGDSNRWCSFQTVNLAHSHFIGLGGVYIIWSGGQSPRTIYVGQGQIADRLQAHRSDPSILQYSSLGLFVTWAKVDSQSQNGVELFLGQKLNPKESVNFPQATPISVNLPW